MFHASATGVRRRVARATLRSALRRTFVAGLVVAVGVPLAGCGDDTQPASPNGNGVDFAFVQDMTLHHGAALVSAEIARRRAKRPLVRGLAATIVARHRNELKRLSAISTALTNEGVQIGDLGLDESTVGLATDNEFLERSTSFDRTFLVLMTRQHERAIRMARVELAEGRNAAARQLAEAIVAEQTRELAAMGRWRRSWDGPDLPAGARSSLSKPSTRVPEGAADGASPGRSGVRPRALGAQG